MRSAASTASRIACSALSRSTTTPDFTPRDFWWPMPMHLRLVRAAAQQLAFARAASACAIMQHTLLEPTSSTVTTPERRAGPFFCAPSQLIPSSPASTWLHGFMRFVQRGRRGATAASGVSCTTRRPASRMSTAAMSRDSRPASRSIVDELGDRLILAVLGQLDRDAVFEPHVPAPLGNAHVALDPRRQLGMVLDLGDESFRGLRRADADHQRQHRLAAAAEGRDHARRTARSAKARCRAARSRTACAPRCALPACPDRLCAPPPSSPRAARRCARARPRHRSRSVEVQPSRPSRSSMSISEVSRWPDDLDLSTAKPMPRCHGLDDDRDLAAEIGAIEAARRRASPRSGSTRKSAARSKSPLAQARRARAPARRSKRGSTNAAERHGRPSGGGRSCAGPPAQP